MKSAFAGELPPNTCVHVREWRTLPDGTRRADVCEVDSWPETSGWVSCVAKDGGETLQPTTADEDPEAVNGTFGGRRSELTTPRAGTCGPGILTYRSGANSSRAPSRAPTFRQHSPGDESRRARNDQLRHVRDAQIDERMDRRLTDHLQGRQQQEHPTVALARVVEDYATRRVDVPQPAACRVGNPNSPQRRPRRSPTLKEIKEFSA